MEIRLTKEFFNTLEGKLLQQKDCGACGQDFRPIAGSIAYQPKKDGIHLRSNEQYHPICIRFLIYKENQQQDFI